jgi:hypothetical protein
MTHHLLHPKQISAYELATKHFSPQKDVRKALFKRRRLGVQATFFARRPRRPGKIEYGVRLGAVGVWATPFSPWATPNLGLVGAGFWRSMR